MALWDIAKQKATGTYDPSQTWKSNVNAGGPVGAVARGIQAGEKFADTQNQYQDIMNKLSERYTELSDPNSEYYQEFRRNLQKVLSSAMPTTNSLLGLARAGGVGVEGSSTIANEQRKASEGRIADYATNATSSAFLQGSGQASKVLQAALSGNLSFQQLMEQMRQFNQSQPTAGDYIGGGLATGLGLLLGGK